MRTPLILALTLCLLSAPAMAEPPGERLAVGYRDSGDALARKGIRQAGMALADHRGLSHDYRQARTPQERMSIEALMEQQTERALRDVLKGLGQIYRGSPASRVLIHQIAQDALASGNRGDVRARTAYNLEALRQIAALQP